MRFVVAALALLAVVGPVRAQPLVQNALCLSDLDFAALPEATRAAHLQAIGPDGIDWHALRTAFPQTQIEGTGFGPFDAVVEQAKTAKVDVLGVLTLDSPDTFPAFARSAARQYRTKSRPTVVAWEIGNEPTDPAAYAKPARSAARAIHAVTSAPRVVLGSLAAPFFDGVFDDGDWAFIEGLAPDGPRGDRERNRREYLTPFNAIGMHPIEPTQALLTPEGAGFAPLPGFIPEVTQFDSLEDRLPENRSLWATEIGWPTGGAGVSEVAQAQYLVRGTTIALASGASRVCWKTIADGPNAATDATDATGLLRFSASPTGLDPKPAFVAARVLSDQLANTQFVRDLRSDLALAPEDFALCFRTTDGFRTVIVLWTISGATNRVAVQRIAKRARQARLVELDGSLVTLPDGSPLDFNPKQTDTVLESAPGAPRPFRYDPEGGKGSLKTLTVTLSDSPVYLVFDQNAKGEDE